MPRRSSSMSHLLRDVRGSLTDVSATPPRQSLEPVQEQLEPSDEPFDVGSYNLLRKATRIVESMIGASRTRNTRKGNRLVYRVMNLMRTGQTLELEKLRSRFGHYSVPSSNKWARTGGF